MSKNDVIDLVISRDAANFTRLLHARDDLAAWLRAGVFDSYAAPKVRELIQRMAPIDTLEEAAEYRQKGKEERKLSKFTPGPWRPSRLAETSIEAESGRPVCSIGYQNTADTEGTRAENLANAVLIATAPDMFDTLSRLLDGFDGSLTGSDMDAAISKARDIIARVTGEPRP